MSNEVITTVVTPASSYDLTDLATVKSDLGITTTADDAFLTRGITQVSKAIANYCNRVFPVETVQDVIYIDRYLLLNKQEGSKLQLSRFPLVTITSVVEDSGLSSQLTLVSGTDFLVKSAIGQLFRVDVATAVVRYWTARTVTVQYTAGYSSIPSDLVEACLRQMSFRYKQKDRDPALISEESPGVGMQRWWIGTIPGMNGVFTPEVSSLLDPYVMPAIG